MRRAVIYARFSCSRQREASIEDQLRVCHEWCDKNGYTVVHEYCDYAMSGRTDHRPEFQAMVDHAGESEIVLVYMMDRFSRDVYDAPIYKKRLRDKGVKVVSATEAMPDGPESILIESIYEAMAAMESAHTARRVRHGMEGNALKCMHNGVRVFGYSWGEDGRYVVNPGEAEVVREVFSRRISGESLCSIRDDLRARGIRTSYGRPASYNFVQNMIRNEKYTGVYLWGGVRVEGGMPAIVSKGDFAMANEVRSHKVRATEDWGEFPLSGKAICGRCGMNMRGTSGHGRHGAKYEYYECSKRCGLKAVRADWLEGAIVDAIRDVLSDRDEAMRIARIVEAHAKDDGSAQKVADAKRRAREAQRGIDRLMDAIAGGLDAELAKPKIEELRTQKDVAEAEVSVQESASAFSADDFADFLQFGSTLDDSMLLKAFVWQVRVDDDSVTVTLNYDIKESEPARVVIPRTGSDDCSVVGQISSSSNPSRPVSVLVSDGLILLRFPRAA